MLKVWIRHAPPLVHAFRVALAAWIGLAWSPGTQAAEAASAETAVFTPFRHYQGWRDEPLQDWREANERVGEIGGWRTYLREAQPDGDGANSGQAHHGHHGH